MKTETSEVCTCEESEIDVTVKSFIFYLCKKCGGAVKRKEHICVHYLSCGYCGLAEKNNYVLACTVEADFTKCKSGHAEGEENNGD